MGKFYIFRRGNPHVDALEAELRRQGIPYGWKSELDDDPVHLPEYGLAPGAYDDVVTIDCSYKTTAHYGDVRSITTGQALAELGLS